MSKNRSRGVKHRTVYVQAVPKSRTDKPRVLPEDHELTQALLRAHQRTVMDWDRFAQCAVNK